MDNCSWIPKLCYRSILDHPLRRYTSHYRHHFPLFKVRYFSPIQAEWHIFCKWKWFIHEKRAYTVIDTDKKLLIHSSYYIMLRWITSRYSIFMQIQQGRSIDPWLILPLVKTQKRNRMRAFHFLGSSRSRVIFSKLKMRYFRVLTQKREVN